MTDCGEGEFKASTEKAHKSLEQLEQHAAVTASSVIKQTRRGYQTLNLMLGVLGEALPASLMLMAESAFMMAEQLVSFATAESMTVIGIIKGAATFMLAMSMFTRAALAQRRAGQAESQIRSLISLTALYS